VPSPGHEPFFMNTSEPNPGTQKIMLRVIDVVAQKGQGYTVIVQLPSDSELTSEEMWKTALPGTIQGATRVSGLWHLYYYEKPPFSAGDTFEVTLPASGARGSDAS
jgi:hypothetical protein